MVGAGIDDRLDLVVGTPASASARIAASRLVGAEARGSIVRAVRRSRLVTDTITLTWAFAAIGASRSRSRTTRADLVVIVSG